MRSGLTGMLGGIVVVALLAGCTPKARAPLAKLPYAELSASTPTPIPSTTRRQYPRPIKTPVPVTPKVSNGSVPAGWRVPASRRNRWRYIVIHHSATDTGNAATFDAVHKERGWDELGYHFVIDNGNGMPDGRVEVGSRWPKQKWGAHCGGTPNNEYNEYGIGICVVGDFSGHMPSRGQLASLRKLTIYLARTYNIPQKNIIGHRDAPNASTACPGNAFHKYVVGPFRAEVARKARAGR